MDEKIIEPVKIPINLTSQPAVLTTARGRKVLVKPGLRVIDREDLAADAQRIINERIAAAEEEARLIKPVVEIKEEALEA